MGDEYHHSHDYSCFGAAMLMLPALKAAERCNVSLIGPLIPLSLRNSYPRAHSAYLSFVVFISSPVWSSPLTLGKLSSSS